MEEREEEDGWEDISTQDSGVRLLARMQAKHWIPFECYLHSVVSVELLQIEPFVPSLEHSAYSAISSRYVVDQEGRVEEPC